MVNAPTEDVDGARVAAAMPNDARSGLVVEILKPSSGSQPNLEEIAGVPVSVRLVDEAPQPLTDGGVDRGRR